MKLLRETIRKLILENINTSKYEHLASMLDAHEFQVVQQAIEVMQYAPDMNADGKMYAKVNRHIIHKGLSPSAQSRGEKGINRCHHVFTLELNRPFMEYMDKMFDEHGNKSPGQNIVSTHNFKFRNFGPDTIKVFAEDENQKWSDVCEEWNDPSVLQIEMPV